MKPAFLVSAGALTPAGDCISKINSLLNREAPFYIKEEFHTGPYILKKQGIIPDSFCGEDSLISLFQETLSKAFPRLKLKPKNLKFFNRPSYAVVRSIVLALSEKTFIENGLLQHLSNTPERAALYVNAGPANANLKIFLDWASENLAPDNKEKFTNLMASEVIKLLPNIMMSNIALNLPFQGENTIVSGWASNSAWAVSSACECLENNRADIAVATSGSFPYEYFNIHAYFELFDTDFFDPPLCEAASCAVLVNKKMAAQLPESSILGAITDIEQQKGSEKLKKIQTEIKKDSTGTNQITRITPGPSGNFLGAAEPLNSICLLHEMNKFKTPNGASISFDKFNNISIIRLTDKKSALKLL